MSAVAETLAPTASAVPTPGAGYPERVRQVIPARYHDEAFGEFADDDAIEAARRRFALVAAR